MDGIKQQISKLIDKSNNVLVAVPENINGDALGSALALNGVLQKLGKSAQLIIPEEIPAKFEFLPKTNSLSCNILREREFVLSIKNPKNHINDLCYEKKEDLLHIYLGAKEKIKEEDIRLSRTHPFDLIFTLNIQNFEHLGKAFEYNPELFFETPVINIDNHAANESFGAINLVDITSSSVSEIIMGLIDFIDRNLLIQDIATWILAGLIDATCNFQSPKTTPRTFNNAALLISRGGDQQKIIRYFYKTKSLDFLRLWGRILHKLSWNGEKKLVWGKIEQYDSQEINTDLKCLSQIFEEIKMAFPEMKTTFLIWDAEKKIKGIIYSLNPELLKNLNHELNGTLKNSSLLFSAQGRSALGGEIKASSLEEAEKQILDLINKEL